MALAPDTATMASNMTGVLVGPLSSGSVSSPWRANLLRAISNRANTVKSSPAPITSVALSPTEGKNQKIENSGPSTAPAVFAA